MLVLSRRTGESILLHLPNGDTVEVKLIELRPGGQVRLGITAPSNVTIRRDELPSSFTRSHL